MYCGGDDPLSRANYLVGGKGGGWGGGHLLQLVGNRQQANCVTDSPACHCNLPKWERAIWCHGEGGGEAFPGQHGGQAVRLPIRQGATIGQEIRQQIMPTVVDHCSYFLGLIMQQSIVNIGSGKERSLPRTPALIFTQNPNPNVCSSFLKRFF